TPNAGIQIHAVCHGMRPATASLDREIRAKAGIESKQNVLVRVTYRSGPVALILASSEGNVSWRVSADHGVVIDHAIVLGPESPQVEGIPPQVVSFRHIDKGRLAVVEEECSHQDRLPEGTAKLLERETGMTPMTIMAALGAETIGPESERWRQQYVLHE